MNPWIGALIAVVAGVLVGSIAGRVLRKVLSHERQPTAIREVAGNIAGFAFALCVAAGLITAVGIVAPEQLDTIPRGLVNYFPRVMVAGLLLLLGNIAGSVLGMAVGRAAQRATGEDQPAVGKTVRGLVLGTAVLLAVSQLGMDTTLVNLAVAALLFSLGATFTLLTALGGRDVARNVAAGRYVRKILPEGSELLGAVPGTVVRVHSASVELRTADGRIVHVPAAALLSGPLEYRTATDASRVDDAWPPPVTDA